VLVRSEAPDVDDPDHDAFAVMVVGPRSRDGASRRLQRSGALYERGGLVEGLTRLDIGDRVLMDERGDTGRRHLGRGRVQLPADPAGVLLNGILHGLESCGLEVTVELDEDTHPDVARRFRVALALLDALLDDRAGEVLHLRDG